MTHNGSGNSTKGNEPQVVDFGEVRSQRLDEKRRKTERIFFKQLLGVYCVTEGEKMRPLDVVDISDDGLSFQAPFDASNPWPNDLKEFPVRLYFSQDTYLPITVKILNARPCIEAGTRYIRYGCTVDQSLTSYAAFEGFVRFLKLYSEHAHKDKGDMTLFYL